MLAQLAAMADQQLPAKHPQVLPFAWPPEAGVTNHFVKVFHRRKGVAQLKDLWGQSKARRFWRQGLALNEAGFNVPTTVVFGEKRRGGLPERSLVLTKTIDGQPAPSYLASLNYSRDNRAQLKMKRGALAQLAAVVRRFHDLGFVHGDLVATNIFVVGQSAESLAFYLMDNDRSQRYSPWLTVYLRKRNLVQLNRMPLPHLTLQDRMRFLHGYFGVAKLTRRHCRFARWLERRTRQRRNECDGINPNGSFRELMRWVPVATHSQNN